MECSCRRGQLGLCCTLVLRTVEVAIEEASNSSEATRIVQEMASFSDRVKLSRLTLFSHDLDSNPQADILERAKLLKSAICGGKCSRIGGQPRDRAQIGAPELPSATWGHTSIDDVGVEEVSINRDDCSDMIESLCSALAVTQSTHSVNFSLLQDHLDDEERARQWQWMAFVFFSRQSRTRSSLRRVIITGDLCLTVEDAEAVADILSADNPEEQLVGYPPRTFPRDPQGSTQFHVQEHALVKTDSIHGRVVEFPMWADVCGVSLLNDDGESEWVEVLVPGLGACSTLRENVSPCEPNEMDVATTQISLTLEVSGWSDFEGMQRFLEVIQPALQHLALISVGSEVAQDISWILEASPTLSRLTISGRTVETAAFIRAYERTAPQLESLCCIFDDVRLLVRALSNKDSVLTRQLRYLRLRVTDSMVTQDENWVSALEDMLRLNRSLEYLTVYTSIDAFDGTRRSHVMDLPHATASGLASVRAHHLEKLPVVGTKFPMECKVAFLSVFTRAEAGDPLKRQKRPTLTLPRTLAELNRHVTTIIFGFAATCAVRKVFVV
ncbi:hypothetical protein BBJ28_00002634 [Nothophytophthora sp. Chile5]|nr:hypothetical protein BBJ28_00002634 [Nothophytophthora sp. Chile5]